MGCWESETEELPGPEFQQTDFSKQSQAFLTSLLSGSAPKLNVADMTEAEKASYNLLQSVISAPTPDIYYKGLSELEKTLSGGYDPRTSPYYEGIKQEAAIMKEAGVSGLRRGSQAGGMFNSDTSKRAEGAYTSNMDAQVLSQLGQLFENERQRMTGATGMALNYAKYPQESALQKIMAGMTYGSLPRDIENQKNMATYQSEMFPYTNQAPIAQNLMNMGSNWYQPQFSTTPSTFSQILSVIPSIVGMFNPAKAINKPQPTYIT